MTFAPEPDDDNLQQIDSFLNRARRSLRSKSFTRAEADALLHVLDVQQEMVDEELMFSRLISPSVLPDGNGEGISLERLLEPGDDIEARCLQLRRKIELLREETLRTLD